MKNKEPLKMDNRISIHVRSKEELVEITGFLYDYNLLIRREGKEKNTEYWSETVIGSSSKGYECYIHPFKDIVTLSSNDIVYDIKEFKDLVLIHYVGLDSYLNSIDNLLYKKKP